MDEELIKTAKFIIENLCGTSVYGTEPLETYQVKAVCYGGASVLPGENIGIRV